LDAFSWYWLDPSIGDLPLYAIFLLEGAGDLNTFWAFEFGVWCTLLNDGEVYSSALSSERGVFFDMWLVTWEYMPKI